MAKKQEESFPSPVLPVGAQTPSSAPQQEEEAGSRGATNSARPQTPAEWSCAPGSFPVHVAKGVKSADTQAIFIIVSIVTCRKTHLVHFYPAPAAWHYRGQSGGDSRRTHSAPAGGGHTDSAGGGWDAHRL